MHWYDVSLHICKPSHRTFYFVLKCASKSFLKVMTQSAQWGSNTSVFLCGHSFKKKKKKKESRYGLCSIQRFKHISNIINNSWRYYSVDVLSKTSMYCVTIDNHKTIKKMIWSAVLSELSCRCSVHYELSVITCCFPQVGDRRVGRLLRHVW